MLLMMMMMMMMIIIDDYLVLKEYSLNHVRFISSPAPDRLASEHDLLCPRCSVGATSNF